MILCSRVMLPEVVHEAPVVLGSGVVVVMGRVLVGLAVVILFEHDVNPLEEPYLLFFSCEIFYHSRV